MKHHSLKVLTLLLLLSPVAQAQTGPDDLSKGSCTYRGQQIGFTQMPENFNRVYEAKISDEMSARLTINRNSFVGYTYQLSLIHGGEFVVTNRGFASFEDDKIGSLSISGSLRGDPVSCTVQTGTGLGGAAQ